jgi:aldehyde:ferredoxin oxidoreductase
MQNGYCGKILRVDLTREVIKEETLREGLIRDFLGGPGIASKILFDEVPPKISAFDPLTSSFSRRPVDGTPCCRLPTWVVFNHLRQEGGVRPCRREVGTDSMGRVRRDHHGGCAKAQVW